MGRSERKARSRCPQGHFPPGERHGRLPAIISARGGRHAGGARGFALLAAWASLSACATPPPGPGRISDPAARVHVDRLDRGPYSIRQLISTCRLQPAAGRRERLIALADAMWVRFGRKERGAVTEARNPDAGIATDEAIAGFWTSLPADDVTRGQWRGWRDTPAQAREVHWSAAFTSWLMCEAGLSPAQCARSYRHRDYINHARRPSGPAAHRVVNIDDARRSRGICCAQAGILSGRGQ
jgi:hypothetical protein